MNNRRHHARQAALQILYFWEIGRTPPEAAIESFFEEHDPDASEEIRSFASQLVHGTVDEVAELDTVVEQHATHWRIGRLAVIDRLILRLAVWELRHTPDVPPVVIINEAMELARAFSAEESVRFVNGVLDAVRKTMQDERPQS